MDPIEDIPLDPLIDSSSKDGFPMRMLYGIWNMVYAMFWYGAVFLLGTAGMVYFK